MPEIINNIDLLNNSGQLLLVIFQELFIFIKMTTPPFTER